MPIVSAALNKRARGTASAGNGNKDGDQACGWRSVFASFKIMRSTTAIRVE
jgi:hypothetical protein